MINKTLNRAEAEELFLQEAVLFFGQDAVPEYRVYELFGEPAADFATRNMHFEGYLACGRDYNSTGACTEERPMIKYFCKAGFMKLVSEHNYLLVLVSHKNSDGGKMADAAWKLRYEELEQKQREEEAKREERRKKRAAVKAAKNTH